MLNSMYFIVNIFVNSGYDCITLVKAPSVAFQCVYWVRVSRMRMDGASAVHSDGKEAGDPPFLQEQEQEQNQCKVNPYFLVCST